METIRTDDPKPAPFPVGTRLRYKGDRTITESKNGGPEVTVLYPGIEVVVSKCAYGHKGTGKRIDNEDDLGPIYDETEDNVSVYEVKHGHGRCISNETAHEWEALTAATEKKEGTR